MERGIRQNCDDLVVETGHGLENEAALTSQLHSNNAMNGTRAVIRAWSIGLAASLGILRELKTLMYNVAKTIDGSPYINVDVKQECVPTREVVDGSQTGASMRGCLFDSVKYRTSIAVMYCHVVKSQTVEVCAVRSYGDHSLTPMPLPPILDASFSTPAILSALAIQRFPRRPRLSSLLDCLSPKSKPISNEAGIITPTLSYSSRNDEWCQPSIAHSYSDYIIVLVNKFIISELGTGSNSDKEENSCL